MTTRRTPSTDTATDDEANVVDINSGPADLDLDAGEDNFVPTDPFRVRLGGRTWVIEQPDFGLVTELEEAKSSNAFFALMFDEQWPEARPLLHRLKDPTKLARLARQFGDHFELNTERVMEAIQPNRQERRRRVRGR